MKISFDDKSYIECRKLEDGKIVFIISAKDQENVQKKITNTVELDDAQFKQLISDL